MNTSITVFETRQRLKIDRERLLDFLKALGSPLPSFPLFYPSFLCVFLHRWSHYLFCGNHRRLARLVWHFNLIITGADMSPLSDLGEGLVILHPAAVTLYGKAGKNLTLYAQGGLGAGIGREDIGAGIGLPVLGDDVTLLPRAMILGPVRIGDQVQCGAGCVVTKNIPGRAVLFCGEPRIFQQQPSFRQAP